MKKENSIKLNIEPKTNKKIAYFLPEAIIVSILSGSFSAMLFGTFSSASFNLFFVLATGFICAVPVLLSNTKFGKYIPFAVSAAGFASLLVVAKLKNGFLILLNDLLIFLTEKTGRIFIPFNATENGYAEISLFIIGISAGIIASNAAGMFLVFTLSIVGLASGFLSTDLAFMFFVIASVVKITGCFYDFDIKNLKIKKLYAYVFVPCLCVVAGILLISFVPEKSGTYLKKFAEKNMHELIYDSKTNAMPEGDFENLGALNNNIAPALKITMETPQKLYLKGFVGEIYNGKGWEKISNNTLASYSEDFYILHKNGFYGQNAVSKAIFALEKTNKSNLSIENVSACSKTAFLPYALCSEKLEPEIIGDRTNSFGKNYSVEYVPGGLSEWFVAQVKLSEKQGKNDAVDEHLANEYFYRKFVRENYLSIPEEAYITVDKLFSEEKASTATEIISTILLYLEKNVTYDEDSSYFGEEDFVSFFLTKTARGYSVHYATAATLMLRYFGIPARYVEGYFLSAEDASQYKSGEEIVLTEENSHAWAEYYLEGVGWIPFETTPGYMDDELEKAAFTTSGESGKRYEQSELPETNVEQDRPKDDITEAPKDYTVLILAVAGVGLLLIIVLLSYLVIMRKRLKKALKAIENADNKTAVPMRFGYCTKLIENADLSKEKLALAGYDKAFEINIEALFSEHEVSDEQRKTVDACSEKILEECKKSWSIFEKFKYKFIRFIY